MGKETSLRNDFMPFIKPAEVQSRSKRKYVRKSERSEAISWMTFYLIDDAKRGVVITKINDSIAMIPVIEKNQELA